MTNHNLSLPIWQSRALLLAGLAALGAAALGSGVYAFQSASASQLLRLSSEFAIPTDAVTKTVLSFSAELGVAFGAVVTAWLWRTGRKGLRLQAYLAMVMTAWALAISVGNLAGYFAWTRAQHVAETARASESYRVAHQRREAGAYLSRSDEAMLRRGEAPADAERELGDVARAFGLHILILGFGAAYRLPAPRKAKRRRKSKQSRAQGKPKLVVAN